MKFCPQCRTLSAVNAKFCANCAFPFPIQQVQPMPRQNGNFFKDFAGWFSGLPRFWQIFTVAGTTTAFALFALMAVLVNLQKPQLPQQQNEKASVKLSSIAAPIQTTPTPTQTPVALYSSNTTTSRQDKTGDVAEKIYGNKNSLIYHWPGCPDYEKVSDKNRIIFNSADEAEKAGYRAAKNCTSSNLSTSNSNTKSEKLEASSKSNLTLPTAPTTSQSQSTVSESRSTSSAREYITGPRGGCYYINGNGNKTYVDHSFCGGSSESVYVAPKTSSSSSSSKYIRGPRGGCYYINGSGNKTYVDRSMCN